MKYSFTLIAILYIASQKITLLAAEPTSNKAIKLSQIVPHNNSDISFKIENGVTYICKKNTKVGSACVSRHFPSSCCWIGIKPEAHVYIQFYQNREHKKQYLSLLTEHVTKECSSQFPDYKIVLTGDIEHKT